MKKGFLIDMDGVIYSGDDLIPGSDIFIKELQKRKIPFLFMTNNSQRSPIDTVNKVKKMGISIKESNVYTSAMATSYFLSFMKPKGTAYVLGEGGLISSLHAVGYELINDKPDYVVLGEGRNFTLEMVNNAVEMILSGSKFIATNLDPSPRKRGWNNLGIKSIVSMIEEATGVKAFSVGKPSPVMMRAARKKLGLTAQETIVIRDTLSTDILGGIQLGYNTVLTLSGVSKVEDLEISAFVPSMIVDSCSKINLDEVLKR
ncbi:HAD-IIA family hydrolase [Aquimarina latercula]|uniref:HAD-IIA family hydrolase n=1 Tax=Aquimarina latercula TaxID=987 RepID=UPI000410C931|nr:HAD-IIA family hydrolase [Aquimarina latercula]